jgi:hypothetical protein
MENPPRHRSGIPAFRVSSSSLTWYAMVAGVFEGVVTHKSLVIGEPEQPARDSAPDYDTARKTHAFVEMTT